MNPPPLPRSTSRRGWLIAVIVLAVMLGLSVLFNMGMMVSSSFRSSDMAYPRGGNDQFPRLTERWSYGYGEVKVVRIALSGVIVRREQAGMFGGYVDKIGSIQRQVQAAMNDEDVGCILFEVDSPGGAITPSDEIYQALLRFKQSRPDRKVVAFTRDMAASGGYYAALAADWIIAEPTSIVGSIGVIMQSLNWKKLTDDIGIRDVTIKSGSNKDMLNPFRETDERQLGLLQEMIDTMHERFKSLVGAHRSIDAEALNQLSDGRIFTADQALDHALIDQIGYWDDAAKRTQELLGVDSARFIRYTQQTDLFTLLTQVRLPLPASTSLLDLQTPRMMYLWRP